jgi:hypothetical protein
MLPTLTVETYNIAYPNGPKVNASIRIPSALLQNGKKKIAASLQQALISTNTASAVRCTKVPGGLKVSAEFDADSKVAAAYLESLVRSILEPNQ